MDENQQTQHEQVAEDLLKTLSMPDPKPKPRKSILYCVFGIFILLSLILLIGYAGYQQQLNQMAEEAKRTIPTPMPRVQASPTPDTFPLIIDSPTQDTLITDDTVVVSGQTIAGASLVIYTDTDETATDAASNGFFSAQISLEAGSDEIIVTAFAPNGQEKTATVKFMTDKP